MKTLLDGEVVDVQTATGASGLQDNAFVSFDAQATLAATAATPLTGGANATVTVASHQDFLDRLESRAFHAVGVAADETMSAVLSPLYANFTKRMRDEMGIKFQCVLYRHAADYEGVVNVQNKVLDAGASVASLIYWATGIVAGTAVNQSALNAPYEGEYTVDADYKQSELEAFLDEGKFALHRVGDDLRVLGDINSLVTTTETKGDVFKENRSIRVIDKIGNDIAALFNSKYLGRIPNNDSGRVSLWADIVKHHRELERITAIEDFEESAVVVSQGATKKSVVVEDAVHIVNAMAQLYMTCVIE